MSWIMYIGLFASIASFIIVVTAYLFDKWSRTEVNL
jgi:hypothetical protein